MTIGTGIVLSAIFLGLVALLIGTKEKWTWKGLFLYPSLAVVILGAVIAGGVYGYTEGYYGPNKFGREMEYAGVRLRSTKSDVLFALGKPDSERPADADGEVSWSYKHESEYWLLAVSFDEKGAVVGITSALYEDRGRSYLPRLKEIGAYTDLTNIQRRLGKAEVIEDIDGGLERFYRFPNYNFSVSIGAGRITGMGIRDYERLPLVPLPAEK